MRYHLAFCHAAYSGDSQRLLTPRVQVAIFKTLWNGWTTSARFQNTTACVLKCSEAVDALGLPTAQDKLEHYFSCPFTKHCLCHTFGLPGETALKSNFCFVADGLMEEPKKITLLAITIYAVMRATNHFRLHPPRCKQVVFDFIEETCKSATSGHRASQTILREATSHRR